MHQNLVRRYLEECGVQRHQLRFVALPASRGCGEQYVRIAYPSQVQALRSRQAKARTALIVLIDADSASVKERHQQLATQLEGADQPTRTSDEPIVLLVPKRHVETWIGCLRGLPVDEDRDFKRPTPSSEDISQAAATLRTWVITKVPAPCVDSLDLGVTELRGRL